MTAAVSQLGYLGFGVSDPAAWASFLSGTLGLEPTGAGPDGTLHFRLDDHRSRVQVQPDGPDDLIYLGWLVGDRYQLREMEAQLTEAGYACEQGSAELADQRGVRGLIVVTDPCGLRNEIGYGPDLAVTPFTPGRPMTAGFVAGSQGVGHVVLKSGDPDGYVRFYEETLGLRLSDQVVNPAGAGQPGFAISFYHANGRHHSLAFPLIALPPFALPPMGKRVQHFMIELENLDDLGRGMQIAHEKEELLNFLGRHTNDQMLSCYLTTPGGVGVEYGWGARSVAADDPVAMMHDGDMWGHQVAGKRSIFDLAKPDGPPPPGAVPPGAVPPPGAVLPPGAGKPVAAPDRAHP